MHAEPPAPPLPPVKLVLPSKSSVEGCEDDMWVGVSLPDGSRRTPPLTTPATMHREPSRSTAVGKPMDSILLEMVQHPQNCRASGIDTGVPDPPTFCCPDGESVSCLYHTACRVDLWLPPSVSTVFHSGSSPPCMWCAGHPSWGADP